MSHDLMYRNTVSLAVILFIEFVVLLHTISCNIRLQNLGGLNLMNSSRWQRSLLLRKMLRRWKRSYEKLSGFMTRKVITIVTNRNKTKILDKARYFITFLQ